MATGTGSSQELLNRLLNDTDQRIASLQEDRPDLDAALENIAERFDQAAEIKDDKEREIRMKVLEAEITSLRKEAKQEEEDLARAVLGLNAIIEEMGAGYEDLQRLSPEEKKVIGDAEAKLADAKLQLAEARQKWTLFGIRARAVAGAERAIQESEEGLQEANIEAKRQMRQRLLTHDMEQSLQEFMYKVEKTIKIMEDRVQEIIQQLNNVQTRKNEAFRIKEEAARALETLDQDLNAAEEELRKEEELVDSFVNGTPEHAQQTEKVSNLRTKVEDLRGRRNTAFVLFQSKEKFAAELEVHERTQTKLRDNQLMWITALRSDTEERVVTFKSRLEAMKAMSDQDVAKQLDDLGAEVDQRNAEYMAMAGAASDRVRMEKIEAHPERVARMAKVQAAQAEKIQEIRVREKEAIEKFKEEYGIDPTESSFFHYE